MSNVASALDVGLWIVDESTAGTRANPTAAGFLSTVGQPEITQARGKAQNQEKSGSLGKRPAIPMKYQSGNLKFSTYVKPSGTAGDDPVADKLFQSCFGQKTVTASTSVEYKLGGPNDNWMSLTAYIKRGHTVYTAVGAMVNSATFKIMPSEGDDGIAAVDWDLMFLQMLHTGTAVGTSDGIASEITFSSAEDVRKYSVGSLVMIDTDDNTGAGYEVTALDESTMKITLNAAPSAQASKTVKPFLPAQSEPTGFTVPSYAGVAQEKEGAGAFADIFLTESTFTVNHNLAAAQNEKDGKVFPGRLVRGTARDVTLSAQALFYEDNAKYHAEAKDDIRREVKVPVGSEAGKTVEFHSPIVSIDPPTESGDPQFIQQQSRICYEVSSGNEELTVTFT